MFLGFFTPLPLPGEEGILVNFGNSETGLGNSEPSPAKNNPLPVEPVQKEEKKEVPPPPPQQKTSPPQAAKEVALTQDYEKTAAIEAAEAKKREEQLKEQRRLQQIEAEKRKAEEAERLRKQQEEAEKRRIAEAERKAKEEEKRKINEINSRVQGAFGESSSGTGGKGTGNTKNQGATFPGGNQGVPTGDPDAGKYGQGGSGSGNQGSGLSYSLAGRNAKSLPRPKYPGDDEGIVVVKITVDKYGKVTSAEPGARGTTIMDERFWNEAKRAALSAAFNADDKAPAFQQGTITYRFILSQ
ncbi:MAG: hypothetical protein CR996_01925 [Draconibacterium sp.]|nr:MAG: hypothetical protein CR996_01925 [Draconibacterium sp.]